MPQYHWSTFHVHVLHLQGCTWFLLHNPPPYFMFLCFTKNMALWQWLYNFLASNLWIIRKIYKYRYRKFVKLHIVSYSVNNYSYLDLFFIRTEDPAINLSSKLWLESKASPTSAITTGFFPTSTEMALLVAAPSTLFRMNFILIPFFWNEILLIIITQISKN